MTSPAHPERTSSSALLDRAKELGSDLAHMGTDLAQEARRANRYTKMRVTVIAGWALLSLVTLWAACPSSGPSNSLGADVQVIRESLIGGAQLLVRNDSSEMWTDVVLTLDGTWRYERATVRPHDQFVISMSQFRQDHQQAPRDYRPKSLSFQCREGGFDMAIELR
jgi:hypothetical protein